MNDYTVVIAEDCDMIREMYCAAISRMQPSWKVYSFVTAEDAMDRLPSKVDCVITDYDMGYGKMSGLDFAHQARERMPGVPIYLVSGSIDRTAEFNNAQENGVITRFVGKPVRTSTLIDLIRQQL